MSSIKIRIGASVDSSVSTAFTSVEKSAERAGAAIRKNLGEASTRASRAAASAATAAVGPYKQTGIAAEQAGKKAHAALGSLGTLAEGADKKFKALAGDLKRLTPDLQVVAREAQKALDAIEKAKAREALGLSPSRPRASRYWSVAGGNFFVQKPHMDTLSVDRMAQYGMGAASFLRRSAFGLASSMGIQTSLGALVGKNINEEDVAQGIVNAGYFPGAAGAAGIKSNRGDILAETRQVAIGTGTDRGDILQGLRDFVGKTGDLALGRSILADMAKLSKATDSNMSDMVNAAAEVSNGLGDVPDKAGVINKVMQQIAGQGKLGAVEVRDLAQQMAKLASQAGKFQGGAAANIPILGMLAQEAKIGGGATNATQATTSVARFVQSLTKGNTLKAMRKLGITPFTDESHTSLRDPREIIKDVIGATHGDIKKIQETMPGSIGLKPVEGLAAVYRRTQGPDAKKMQAVNDVLERFQSAMLDTDEITRAFAERMNDSKSKVTVLNEKLAAFEEKVAPTLMKVFDNVAPRIEKGVGDAGDAFDQFARDYEADGITGLLGELADGLRGATTPGPVGGTKAEADVLDPEKQKQRNARTEALAKELNLADVGAHGMWKPSAAAYMPGLDSKALPSTFDYSFLGLAAPGQLASHGAGSIDSAHLAQVKVDATAAASTTELDQQKLAEMEAHAEALRRSGTLGKDVEAGLHAQGVGNADIAAQQAKIAQDKEYQERTLNVLEAIRVALESGRLGLAVATPTTNPDGSTPADSK